MPSLRIDLEKIEANTRLVARLLAPADIRLVGVTKACPGDHRVAAAMLAGGAQALADSRSASIERLRRCFPDVELELLRCQTGAELPGAADLLFVSSADQAEGLLDDSARRPLRMLLMVETGDGREGVPPKTLAAETGRLQALPGITLAGYATNAACAGSAPALDRPLARFLEAVASPGPAAVGMDLWHAASPDGLLSAGGSGLLGLLTGDGAAGPGRELVGSLTELRCGEALLLGTIPGGNSCRRLPGACSDAFILEAPVLEVFEKQGRLQVLVGIGIQDTGAGRLTPRSAGLTVVHNTSDYLGLAFDRKSGEPPATGDRIGFIPDYYGLLAAMTSPFVKKYYAGGRSYDAHSRADSACPSQGEGGDSPGA